MKITPISDFEDTDYKTMITDVSGEIRWSSKMDSFSITENDEIYLTEEAETVITHLKNEPIISLEPRERTQVETSPQKHTLTYANIDTPHYQGRGGVEPIDFISSNNMRFDEGNAIKYIYRAPLKNTPIQDIDKAIDYLKMLKKRYEQGIYDRVI